MHFWQVVTRVLGGVTSPVKYFFMGAIPELISSRLLSPWEQNVEEERRLFYVGMTRAKDVLKITYVKIKNGKEISPSRFVEELFEGV